MMNEYNLFDNFLISEPKVELLPGNPSKCHGSFEMNQINQDNLSCENCDYFLACYKEV